MTAGYLQWLDALLERGAQSLSEAFRQVQVGYVTSPQLPDGGFPGRDGGPDIYYTDFGLRVVSLLDPSNEAVRRAAPFVRAAADGVQNIVECFCLLNCSRMLARCGVRVGLDTESISRIINGQRLAAGGFARPGGTGISAYNTYIGGLCYEVLCEDTRQVAAAASALGSLQGAGGGFKEQPGEGCEQTSATAAAIGFLQMTGRCSRQQAAAATGFLQLMQCADGGFLAHEHAPCSDLLSTFTGLVTLAALDALERVDLPAAARFVRDAARPDGGFAAFPSDDVGDIEYTYYGLACLAILRSAGGSKAD